VQNTRAVTVDVGMDIILAPETADLYVGETLTLTATVVGGSGNKTYLWLRDAVVVGVGASNIFEIPSVTADDAGTYEVYVTDMTHSEAGDNASVVTVDPPIDITVHPAGATLLAGETYVLNVFALGGKGALHYDWRKNALSLGAPDNPFLSVGPVSGADAGDYDVVVTDALGVFPYGRATSAAATIAVNSPLAVAGPNDASVYNDAALVPFQVTASGGVPPYTYAWYKDGVLVNQLAPPIPQPTTDTLNLTPPLQPGLYLCAVTDTDTPPTTRNSSEGRLAVYPHLAIAMQPVGAGVNPGTDVTLTAAVTGGIPPLIHTWRKNGIALPPEAQPGAAVLVLTAVAETDEGVYDLAVEDNGTDAVTSDPASVMVRDAALVFTTQPAGAARYTDEGDYTLTAATAGGEGPVTLEWWFDDGLGGGAARAGNGGSLTIAGPSPADTGDYWCVATDSVGSIDSVTATVRFGLPIEITQQPTGQDRYVDEGDYTLLAAASGGLNTLSFEWFFDEGLGYLPVSIGSGPEYTITDPTVADSGSYFFTVTDGIRSEESDLAELVFADHMTFETQPRGGQVREGEPFTFSVVVSGGLRGLDYVWKRDTDAKIAETTGPNAPVYPIEETELGDTGTYWVEVSDAEETLVSAAVQLVVIAGIPAGGAIGLALLTGAIAAAAAAALRRRK